MIIDKALLDSTSAMAKACERLRMNHNFHESWESKAQIMLNAMEPGTIVPIGRHQNTAETSVVLVSTQVCHDKYSILSRLLSILYFVTFKEMVVGLPHSICKHSTAFLSAFSR